MLIAFVICLLRHSVSNKKPPIEIPMIAHKVTFEHKGSKTGKDENNTLFEFPVKNDSESESAFYMDVRSVYCGEDICKIDPVRLHWDRLGIYHRYSLLNNVKLEKAFGEDFTLEDYDKLDRILNNKNAALGFLHKDELIQEMPSGNAVDALSGATITILKEDYVEGAIWTCYTLWHFVHGGVTHIIRDITGSTMTNGALNSLLKTGNVNEKHFAIEQLQRKKAFDTVSISNILLAPSDVSILKRDRREINKAVIDYVNVLPRDKYFNAINSLINMHNSEITLLSLQSLISSSFETPKHFYDELSEQLSTMTLYQEIDLFLALIKLKAVNSKILLANISRLLSHQRFTIARRVYWFLTEQPRTSLPKSLQQTLNIFYQTNKEKL